VSFEIYNVSTGQFVWTYYPTTAWPVNGADTAWWGFETQDSESLHGTWATDPDTQIWYMSYSWEDTANSTYRNGLFCNGSPGNQYTKKNFGWDGASQTVEPGLYQPCGAAGGTRRADILTTATSDDTLMVYSTP
jgi:hypothetical protein